MTKKESERLVNQTAELEFHFDMASGIHFPKNKSFIPGSHMAVFKTLESKFKAWKRKFPDGKLVVYGHAEKDETSPYSLSQRRAQIVYAFLTGDYETFWKIAEDEFWGIWEYQSILHAFNMYDGPIDGVINDATRNGMKEAVAFINKNEGRNYDVHSKFDLMQIRKDVYKIYVTSPKRAVAFTEKDFKIVSGKGYLGCGCANRYMAGNDVHAENRRATLLFVSELKDFPKKFPCQSTAKPCEAEFTKEGKRGFEGFRCKFYDEMAANEKKVEAAPVVKAGAVAKDDAKQYDRISFDGYEGQGYVIKDFKKYEGKKVLVNPDKVIEGTEASTGNHCVSYVRYFGVPNTKLWKKGPRVCDMKVGSLPEGTVIATMRDGNYYSDSNGRSHVGIYTKHDDYSKYFENKSPTLGVYMMDQYLKVCIQERCKTYLIDANEETKSSKPIWIDANKVEHTHRVQWVADGEEYYVVLT